MAVLGPDSFISFLRGLLKFQKMTPYGHPPRFVGRIFYSLISEGIPYVEDE